MSDGNNRNDGFQDYLDLLEKYKAEYKEGLDDIENIELSSEIENEYPDYSSNVNSDVLDDSDADTIAPPPFKGKIKGKRKQNKYIKKISDWYNGLSKKKQILIKVVAIVLAVILFLSLVLGIFVIQKLGRLGNNVNNSDTNEVVYDDGEFESIEIDIGSAGFKQALIDWATIGNDKHKKSDDVINVLLIGADSRQGTNSGNTDVMMLLSLNKKTKQLKLISFLRDSYLYVESPNGSYCTKLNAAFSMGGPETLVQTIENNYKIDIDNYVMVNFESFKAIIDAMGGVTVDVQQYEASYNYKKFKVELPVGEDVTLNGEQALCFCRIRGCDTDGDVSRTRRQRQVIDSIVSRVKQASVSDLNKYIDILLPYVETGYSKGQILSLGVKAITGGWAGYERTQLQMPPEDCRTSGSANMWIWVVDYQLAAHRLQTEIYGESNITIDENRISIIDVYKGVDYTGSGNSISNTSSKDSNSSIVVTDREPVNNDNNYNNSYNDNNSSNNNYNDNNNNNYVEPTSPKETENNQNTPSTTEATEVVETTEYVIIEPQTTIQETTPVTEPAPTEPEEVTEKVEDSGDAEDSGSTGDNGNSEDTGEIPVGEDEAA